MRTGDMAQRNCVRSKEADHMITVLRRTALAVLVITCTLVATVAPATATTGGPTTLHVEGTQTQVSENLYKSYGGLLGDFWILTFVPLYESDSLVIGTGTERFVGCVDVNLDGNCEVSEPSGELLFDFVEWARFDPSTGALIESRCVHPITGGSESFQGARGLVTMHGVVVNGDARITYQGIVALNAVPLDLPAPQAPTAHEFAADVPPAVRGHC
jgi:hypothetical protein